MITEDKTTVSFARESFEPTWPELLPLLQEHWKEVSHYDTPLDPNVEIYKLLDDVGAARLFTARENGKLVGYCGYSVSADMHSKSYINAIQDVLYIKPEKRGFGKEFLKWCDNQLEEEGVHFISRSTTKKCDYGQILEKLGYEPVATTYCRRIK